jgi:hypothetical protein
MTIAFLKERFYQQIADDALLFAEGTRCRHQ